MNGIELARKLAGTLVIVTGVMMVFSAFMWIAREDNELWFQRLALGTVLLGLWYIGSRESK